MTELETNSTSNIAFVFPGQGSQSVGMGYELCNGSPEARVIFEEADEALGFHLSKLCFEGPEDELRQTINAQPAIFTMSIACLKAASVMNNISEPTFVAGHSLGEYTALIAADVLDFADGIRIVRERGRLMQEAGIKQPGGMAAIIGLDVESLEEVCIETSAEIANMNCSGQIVISGTKEAIARSMDLAKSRGAKRVVPLQVSGAFHSTLMRPAVEGMTQVISEVNLRPPTVPIIANSTAKPVTSVDEVKEELIQQICNCVKWQPSVEYMVNGGISTFVEIGPGQVLSGLIKRISSDVTVHNMNDIESIKTVSL